jgi:hypothetical protein
MKVDTRSIRYEQLGRYTTRAVTGMVLETLFCQAVYTATDNPRVVGRCSARCSPGDLVFVVSVPWVGMVTGMGQPSRFLGRVGPGTGMGSNLSRPETLQVHHGSANIKFIMQFNSFQGSLT